jgi:uncharacterized integral membrane protein (TIGR00698 family)
MWTVLYVIIGMIITLPIATTGLYAKKNLPGVALCLVIALPAWLLGRWVGVVGGAVFGILIGMLLANFWRCPDILKPGIQTASKRILQSAVLLLGFSMNFGDVLRLGGQTIILIVAVVACVLLAAFIIGKRLKAPVSENILIGIGTAICGGSAIAAAAPVIKASDKAVATAISTIFLFNVAAVFIYPAIGSIIAMDANHFGIWAGLAINDTSSVLAAADTYGSGAVESAAVVKLTRTLMIIPVTIILAIIQSKKDTGGRSEIKILKAFPWFVAGFVAASIIKTVDTALGGIIPAGMTAFWGSTMSRYLIVSAMVAIGLSTNVTQLIRHGKKPIILGLLCSITVATVSIALIRIFL